MIVVSDHSLFAMISFTGMQYPSMPMQPPPPTSMAQPPASMVPGGQPPPPMTYGMAAPTQPSSEPTSVTSSFNMASMGATLPHGQQPPVYQTAPQQVMTNYICVLKN